MLIMDEKNNILSDPNFEAGYIERKQRPVIHRYIIDTPAQTHLEILREYENGGKDVETITDVPEKSHWQTRLETGEPVAYDGLLPEDQKTGKDIQGTQDYYLYIPYTEEQLAERKKAASVQSTENKITALKANLQETDYVAAKIAEGAATREECADILEQRATWRQEINQLEAELITMGEENG